MTSGLKMLTTFASPTPSHSPRLVEQRQRVAVAVVGELGDERPADLAARRAAPCRAASAERRAAASAAFGQGATGDERLETAPVRATGTTFRTVGPDDHVAELSRCSLRAAVDLPAEHDPAGDSGAERQHHRVALTLGGAGVLLSEQCEVAVVVDERGQPDPLGHHIGKGDAR